MFQTKRQVSSTFIVSIYLALSCSSAWADLLAPNPRVTIIIDDIGNNLALGKLAVQLPGEVTCAIMPYTPNGARLAKLAFENGKQVILHVPMQSHDTKRKLGAGALLISMEERRYRRTLVNALKSVPHVSGLNNHMGSLLTEHRQPMTWLMHELKKRGLYFIDSLTSPDSVARQTALSLGVPSLTRDVFLDNNQSIEAIDKAFQKLLRVVRLKGYAIAIGHPYPTTLRYLKEAIPKLEQQGISLISASTMIAGPDPANWKKYASNYEMD
ncbi:MAG: divergent polysaccharide deacetylase family protein [Pseudomonadales bacterium]|nr:divergent polysaccharide deacetylase family protein [Pseudomonadales bacterium]